LDNILIGRVWGADALGLYSRAYALLMLPIANLRGPMTRVAFPAMSQLQGRPAEFRAYYRRATALLAIAAMPLTAFLFAASHLMIELVLGPRWVEAAEIFRVLSVAAFIMPIAGFRGVVFLSLGLGRQYFNLGVLNTVCVTVGFMAGLPWGPTGVAVGYVIAVWLVQFPAIAYLVHTTPMTFVDLVKPSVRPAVASLLAAVLTLVCLDAGWAAGMLAQLALAGVVFCVSYLGIYLALPGGKAELEGCIGLWRTLRPTPGGA
jgi:PST family polysaccharide transporter